MVYCPEIKDLQVNNLIWSAQTTTKWKSSTPSFVEEIHSFAGAQWKGIQVGQITCIYYGKQNTTFPVELISNNLFELPREGNWRLGNNTNIYNCITPNTKNCPLKPKLQDEMPTDLGKTIQSLKMPTE